ncbi:MAG TPA: hypothetical protein VIU37_02385 [Candidatus Limnocylindrales bacterium]
MLDELLFGDSSRRLATGLTLLLVAAIAAVVAARRARRSGLRWVPQRGLLGVTLLLTPYGIGLILSAIWDGIGVVVFMVVAMAICGVVAMVSYARST